MGNDIYHSGQKKKLSSEKKFFLSPAGQQFACRRLALKFVINNRWTFFKLVHIGLGLPKVEKKYWKQNSKKITALKKVLKKGDALLKVLKKVLKKFTTKK